ncbi:MAG: nodulation protein NfeD [Deltaproteobacteria bacterium]|nr:nodulation protein NfeD [Deltaproteobacteria bacterium]
MRWKLLLGFLLLAVTAVAQTRPGGFVHLIVINGTINPVTAQFTHESIRVSHEKGAQALIVQLDTPGGLLASTHEIVKDILGAPLPIIVYVAPSGAGAGSAGMFITIAGHVAAMAPATNIGAAHPVGLGGKEGDKVLEEKLENFVASYGEAIASKRGRNVKWAIEAVRKSTAITEAKALDLKVIDLVAADLEELLNRASGRVVDVLGEKVELDLAGARIVSLEMRPGQKFVNLLADPNIAYILLMAGILGLYLEFSNPGILLPGVTGIICLLLALTALQVLPINFTGIALILLGTALLVAEALLPGFGVLGIGGIVAFVFGSLMLFDVSGERLVVDRAIIFTVTAVASVLVLAVGYLVFQAQRQKPALGKEAMVGKSGQAMTRLSPRGKVRVQGEIWNATSDETIEAGEKVIIRGVSDLWLNVKRA